MTKALDAAAEAMAREHDASDGHLRWNNSARAALRAALPAEPTPKMIKVMNDAIFDAVSSDAEGADAYRALRAHLLGEASE